MLRFERECRTPYSEVYTIFDDDQPQGRFDVHFCGTLIHATLCVSERFTTDEIQDIIEDLDDEVLDAMEYLVTPRSSYMTGQILVLDGGLTIV